jgi:hypothetical protein
MRSRKTLTLLVVLVLSFCALVFASGEAWAEPQLPQTQQQHALVGSSAAAIEMPDRGQHTTEQPTSMTPAGASPHAQPSPSSATPPAERTPSMEAPLSYVRAPTKEKKSLAEALPLSLWEERLGGLPTSRPTPPPTPLPESPERYDPQPYPGQPYYSYESYYEHEPSAAAPYQYAYDDPKVLATEPTLDGVPSEDPEHHSGSAPVASATESTPELGITTVAPKLPPTTSEPVVFEEHEEPPPAFPSTEKVLPAPLPKSGFASSAFPQEMHLRSAHPQNASTPLWHDVWGLAPLSSFRTVLSSAAHTVRSIAANVATPLTGGITTTTTESTAKGAKSVSKDTSPATPPPPTPLVPLAPLGGAGSTFFSASSGVGQAGGGVPLLLLLLGVLAAEFSLQRRDGRLFKVFREVPKMSSALLSPLERPG